VISLSTFLLNVSVYTEENLLTEAELELDNIIFSQVKKVSNSLDLKKSEDHTSDKKKILKKLFTEPEAQRQKKSALIEKKVTESSIKKNSVSDIVISSLTALIPTEQKE
jgi:TPP-dependent 2-oxoacid decarboxylase